MSLRPPYEALDDRGYPYIRQAQVIAELPTPNERHEALVEATAKIAVEVALPPVRRIPFGGLVADAFMTRTEAKKHPSAALLLTKGDSVSLDHCPSYK